MAKALQQHDTAVLEAYAGCHGHVFKDSGGALCVAFDRASDAVSAARDAQRALQGASWGQLGPLRIRIAIHTGVGQQRDGDYFGPPLNRCARLRDAAGTSLSRNAYTSWLLTESRTTSHRS
jgi:class 3 adenylate cyclase